MFFKQIKIKTVVPLCYVCIKINGSGFHCAHAYTNQNIKYGVLQNYEVDVNKAIRVL